MIAKFNPLVDLSQPIACIGKYISCINYLLSGEGESLLSSKNLWIDYCVIPLFMFHFVKNKVKTEFFFIECTLLEDINVIVESKELYNLKSRGFSSIVLNFPPYISRKVEISNILHELALILDIVIITSDLNFPIAESQKIRVDNHGE